MFHKSELGEFAEHFPQDETGFVPVSGDNWRHMKFDHADQDPEEEGISEEERARRIEYLDRQWWPNVLSQVSRQHSHLVTSHGPTFIERWERAVNKPPSEPSGFEVE